MTEIKITIKREVSPAIEKLIDVLATAQCYYEDKDDDEEGDLRGYSDTAV